MNMLMTQSKKDGSFRFYINGKRVSKDIYEEKEFIARIRGYAFHSFITKSSKFTYQHRFCIS